MPSLCLGGLSNYNTIVYHTSIKPTDFMTGVEMKGSNIRVDIVKVVLNDWSGNEGVEFNLFGCVVNI